MTKYKVVKTTMEVKPSDKVDVKHPIESSGVQVPVRVTVQDNLTFSEAKDLKKLTPGSEIVHMRKEFPDASQDSKL